MTKQNRLAEWSASFIALLFFVVAVPLIYSSVTSVTRKEVAVRKIAPAGRMPAAADGLHRLMNYPSCSQDSASESLLNQPGPGDNPVTQN